jgi:hypothetical protein
MEEGLKLGSSEAGEPVDQSLYRQAVESLLYIALGSRPDIAYAATTLDRYSSNPDQGHWTAVKHLFRYLKATASKKLTITSARVPNSNPIVAFADADLGGVIHTGKSTTGYLLYVLGNLVLWKSKKQTLVAQSTMESELIASAAVKRQIDWFSGLLSELAPSLPLGASRFRVASPPLLLNDNLACVTVLNDGNFKGDSRHLRLRFYGLHEAVATEKFLVEHVPSVEMLADGLTKALGRIKHEGFLKDLGLICFFLSLQPHDGQRPPAPVGHPPLFPLCLLSFLSSVRSFPSESSLLFRFCLILAHAPFGRSVYIKTGARPPAWLNNQVSSLSRPRHSTQT